MKNNIHIHWILVYIFDLQDRMMIHILVNLTSWINPFPHGICSCNLELVNFQTHIKDRYLKKFLWRSLVIGSLLPSDAKWWHRSRSTLALVMACCLMAPSHYLNPCWLLISEVLWHSPDNNFKVSTQATNVHNEFENILLEYLTHLQWVYQHWFRWWEHLSLVLQSDSLSDKISWFSMMIQPVWD